MLKSLLEKAINMYTTPADVNDDKLSPKDFIPRKYVKVEIGVPVADSLRNSAFQNIPDDITIHVLSFLSPKELTSSSLVNRKFKRLSDSDQIWKHFCTTKFGSNLIKIQNQSYRSLYFQIHENSRFIELEKKYHYEEYLKEGWACGMRCVDFPPQRHLSWNSFTPIGGFQVHPNSSSDLTIQFSISNLQQIAKSLLTFLDLKSYGNNDFRSYMARYHNFMKLKAKYPDLFLVPTYDIEFIWISHLLRPLKYRQDCLRLYGTIIDHKFLLTEAQKQLFDEALVQTCELYKQEFQVEYCELPVTEPSWKFVQEPFMSIRDLRCEANYSAAVTIIHQGAHFFLTYFSFLDNSNWNNPFSFTEHDVIKDLNWKPLFDKYVKSNPDDYFHANTRFLNRILKSYERFLYMAAKYPPQSGKFVHPTYAIDLMWHSHMLCPIEYNSDVRSIVGYFVDHEPWPESCEKKTSFEVGTARVKLNVKETEVLWKNEFGVEIGVEHLLDNPMQENEYEDDY